MEKVPCPSCATPVAPDLNADFFICIRCRAIGLFDEDGSLRRPTDEELDQLLKEPAIQYGISVIAEHHRHHGTPKAH